MACSRPRRDTPRSPLRCGERQRGAPRCVPLGEAQGRSSSRPRRPIRRTSSTLFGGRHSVTLLGHTTKGKCVVDGQHYGFIIEYEDGHGNGHPGGYGPISWAVLRSLDAHAPSPLLHQPNLLGPIGPCGGAGGRGVRGVGTPSCGATPDTVSASPYLPSSGRSRRGPSRPWRPWGRVRW